MDSKENWIKAIVNILARFAKVQRKNAPNFEDPEVQVYYLNKLKGISPNELIVAMESHCALKNEFPSQREILIALGLMEDAGTSAEITASKIMTAITRFSYDDWDGARNFIGKLGEKIVETYGGWYRMTENITNSDMQYLKKQLRELGEALIKDQTYSNSRIGLPDGKANKLEISGETISRNRNPENDYQSPKVSGISRLAQFDWRCDKGKGSESEKPTSGIS